MHAGTLTGTSHALLAAASDAGGNACSAAARAHRMTCSRCAEVKVQPQELDGDHQPVGKEVPEGEGQKYDFTDPNNRPAMLPPLGPDGMPILPPLRHQVRARSPGLPWRCARGVPSASGHAACSAACQQI